MLDTSMTDKILYYIHDPMCSWCYGFRPVLTRLLAALPTELRVTRVLGGLATDNEEPMTPEMRLRLQQTWQRIEHRIPGIRFNYQFWSRCIPRRSTWRACRAVISARHQDPAADMTMTEAIQRAYYQEARNPSDRETLIALAGELGLEQEAFGRTLDAAETRSELEAEMQLVRSLGVDGFPALVLDLDGSRWSIPVDYLDPIPMLALIEDLVRMAP